MRARGRGAWFATGLLLTIVLLGLPAQVEGADFEEEVLMMVQAVEDSWNGQDPERLAGMFAKSADLNSRNGRWYTGPDEIQGYFEEWMARREGDAKEIDIDRARLLTESVAAVDVVSSLRDREGQITEQVTVSVTVERQLDGSWLFTTWRECQSVP